MFLSKHHYAVELARRGNKVYFLEPPEQQADSGKEKVRITPSGTDNLWLIQHRLWFPYKFKFHALSLFHLMMKRQVKQIVRRIGGPIDIVWSFDIGNLYPFHLFDKTSYRIFHPVDEPLNDPAIQAAKGADVIFSVTQEILDKYRQFPAPKFFFNHGVSEDFLRYSNPDRARNNPVRVGLSGNLLRPDIDRETLLQIIESNTDVIFEFWGSFSFGQSNIGGEEDPATRDFISSLQTNPHVILHGSTPSSELAEAIHRMDAFLICYDIKKDQSRGTNYHKIMEYLSTGKMILSNNVTTYKDRPELIRMPADRDHNRALPLLFRETIDRLDEYNHPGLQQKRIGTARENTYDKQIGRIEEVLNRVSVKANVTNQQ
jgi:hypothetical protein